MKAAVAMHFGGPGVLELKDARLVDAGKLRPVVHRTYPLAEIAEAFAELERGRSRGKIVVHVS